MEKSYKTCLHFVKFLQRLPFNHVSFIPQTVFCVTSKFVDELMSSFIGLSLFSTLLELIVKKNSRSFLQQHEIDGSSVQFNVTIALNLPGEQSLYSYDLNY